MRRLPKSHCRAVAPIRLPKVSLIKVNTCSHRETAGEVSLCIVVTYQFTGPAPDGARVDSEGNVYVAISGQGRVMVFNRNGLPIGQIVLPDRDKGRNLKSTSLAIRPGHRELFIVANSGTEPGGAMIFRSGAFAPAPFPFSHQ